MGGAEESRAEWTKEREVAVATARTAIAPGKGNRKSRGAYSPLPKCYLHKRKDASAVLISPTLQSPVLFV